MFSPRSRLPFWLRENPFILCGFRSQHLTIGQCVWSWFWLHNQTMNIWTHLLGMIVTILQYLYRFPGHLTNSVDIWFMNFTFFSIIFSYICSVMYHTFNNSTFQRAVLLSRIDYFGIITHLISCMLSLVYFVYYHHPITRYFFLTTFTILGIICYIMNYHSMFTTIANHRMSSFKRAAIFIAVAAVSAPPQIRIVLTYRWWPTVFTAICCDLAYLGAATIYTLKIPERWLPGYFDMIYSHGIFHLLIVFGAWLSIESFSLISWEQINRIKNDSINFVI